MPVLPTPTLLALPSSLPIYFLPIQTLDQAASHALSRCSVVWGGSQSKIGTTKSRLTIQKCGDFLFSGLSFMSLDARGDNTFFHLDFWTLGLPMVYFHNKRPKIATPAVYFSILNPPGGCRLPFSNRLQYQVRYVKKTALGQNGLLFCG